ncbi:MAG: hypothetical protein J6C50_03435 [Rickettsiales bacterium]|nr:hypothetical protein [Rickettsiales bacterium]
MRYIDLKMEEAIANGNCRHVFLYGDNKCIKVSLRETLLRRKGEQKKKSIVKYLFKPFLKSYDENYRDLKFYKINKNKDIYENIPKFYGICRTNFGVGIIVEYLQNEDNSMLQTIDEYIIQNGVNNKLLLAISNLWTNLLKNNIQIRAPHSKNFLVKEIDGGRLQIYMVDGFGSANLIPLFDYVSYFGRQKIRKKLVVFLNSLKTEFPEYGEYFSEKLFDIELYK